MELDIGNLLRDHRPTRAEIQELRHLHGLTQVQAAKLIGRSVRTLQAWEHGRRIMPAHTWEVYCIRLSILEQQRLAQKVPLDSPPAADVISTHHISDRIQ
jgi:DNA-binding XRE family transcriptional regulator